MNWRKIILISIIFLLIVVDSGCINERDHNYGNMKIISDVFENNGFIPSRYTCDGDDIPPPLEFQNIPNDTVSLVIIMDDIDANNFIHWLIWNIPSNVSGFKENKEISYPQGKNSFGNIGYGGPCPPMGVHHYMFKLYALNTMLNLKEGATRDMLENAMKGHIIEEAELIGLYSR